MSVLVRAATLQSVLGDLPTAAAAARASITRPSPLGLQVPDPNSDEPAEVMGYPVPGLLGAVGRGRWLALSVPALEDLVTALGDEPGRRSLVLACSDDEPMLARRLVRAVPALRIGNVEQVAPGPTSFIAAMGRAVAALESKTADCVIVGVVDSLLDPRRLEALEAEERLKSVQNPVGLMPGEAAAFFALTRRPGPSVLQLDAHHEGPRYRDVVRAGPAVNWVHSPLNGEEPPAREFADVLTICPEATVWHNAISFGDTGLAHAAIGLARAAAAWKRGYAPSDRALVLTGPADGPRGGLWIRRPT